MDYLFKFNSALTALFLTFILKTDKKIKIGNKLWKENIFKRFQASPLKSIKIYRNSYLLFDFAKNIESKKK
jgi:hypothetical protein